MDVFFVVGVPVGEGLEGVVFAPCGEAEVQDYVVGCCGGGGEEEGGD